MSNNFYPTQPGERIDLLDVLRAFAIIGVLICNILFFSGYYYTPFSNLSEMSLSGLNNTLEIIVMSAFFGKFYPILCILFGAGLYMQFAKREQPGFLRFFVWRMLLLLLIGAVHQTFWPGDVVTVYALFAFLLIPVRNLKPKSYLIIALVMFVIHFVVAFVGTNLTSETTGSFERIARVQYPGVDPAQLINSVQNDGFNGFLFIVKAQFNNIWTIPRYIGLSPGILLLLLIGGYLFGSGFFSDKAHKLKYLLIFFFIGIIGSFMMYYVSYSFKIIDGLFLGLAYISLIAMLLKTKAGKRAMKVLIPFGRMALTNYIMQSVIFIIIFYGIGFAYFGKLPLYIVYLIGLPILIFQVLFSKYWLNKYRFGPVEGLWRRLSYGKNFNKQ